MPRTTKGNVFHRGPCIAAGLLFFSVAVTTLLFESCGGCSCWPSVNVNGTSQTGEIVVRLNNIPQPAQGGSNIYTTVSFDGSLTEDRGTAGQSTFHVSRTFESTPTGVNPAANVTGYALRPGRWQVRVSAGSWNASGSGSVNVSRTTTFTFTYGTSSVQVN